MKNHTRPKGKSFHKILCLFGLLCLMIMTVFTDIPLFEGVELARAQQTSERIDVIVVTSSYTTPYEGNGSIYMLSYLSKLLPLYYTIEDASQMTEGFLDNYDVVWLANVTRLTNDQVDAIASYVYNGGKVIIFGQTGKLNDYDQIRQENPFENMCGIDLQAWEGNRRYTQEHSEGSWFSFSSKERMNAFRELIIYDADSLDPIISKTVNITLSGGSSIAYYQEDSERKAIVRNIHGSGKAFFFSTNYPRLIWYEHTSNAYEYQPINPASIGSMLMLTYYAILDLCNCMNEPSVFIPLAPWGYDYIVLPPNFHGPEVFVADQPAGMDGDDVLWWRIAAPGRWNQSLMTHSDFGSQSPRVYALTFFWSRMIKQLAGTYEVSESRSYSYGTQPSGSYPDSGGEMTDGRIGRDSYPDTRYSAWQNTRSLNITIDLSSVSALTNASYRIHSLSSSRMGIYYPDNMTIYTSTDNTTFIQRLNVDFSEVSESSNGLGQWLPWNNESATSYNARWVRFSVRNSEEWTFISEVEIYNSTATTLSSNATNIKNFVDNWGVWGTHGFWEGVSTTLGALKKLIEAKNGVGAEPLLYTGHYYSPPIYSDTWRELIKARDNGTFYDLFLAGVNRGKAHTVPVPIVLTNFTVAYFTSPFLLDAVGGWLFGPDAHGTRALYNQIESSAKYGLGGFAFDYVHYGNELYSGIRTAMSRNSEYMRSTSNYIYLTYPEASEWIKKRWSVNVTDFSTDGNTWTVKLRAGEEISGLTIRLEGTTSVPVEMTIDGADASFTKCYDDRVVLPKLPPGEHVVSITLASRGYPSTPYLIHWNNATVSGFENTSLWIYANSSCLANTKVLDISYSPIQRQMRALIEVPLDDPQSCTRELKFNATNQDQPNSVKVNGYAIPFEYNSQDKTITVNITFSGAENIVIDWGANKVTLNSPNDGAITVSNTQAFNYTPMFSSTIHNSSLWLNLTGTWQRATWNSSPVQNMNPNTISYTFAESGTYIWNVQIFNSTRSIFAASNRTIVVQLEPCYDSVGHNSTTVGSNCSFHSHWSDGDGLSGYTFSSNTTGSWKNETWGSLDGTSSWANITKNLPSQSGVLVQYKFWVNDTDNKWATTGLHHLTTTPMGSPTYSNIGHNTTTRTNSALFSCQWQDKNQLSGFIFSYNGTGSWKNDTWTLLDGTSAWANATKALPVNAGVTVGFRWYCNNTGNVWSNTGIRTLRTTEMWYYLQFDFLDVDGDNIDDRVTWSLWNGSQQLNYPESQATLLNGSYTIRTYYRDHQIHNQTLTAWNDGNQTVGISLQMKRLGTTTRYVAFNQTISTIVVNSATDTNTTFTVTSTNSKSLIIVDVTRNCSFVQKDTVNQTGWTYTNSPAKHVCLSTENLSIWQFYHPPEAATYYLGNTYGESFVGIWNQRIDAANEKVSYRFTAQDSKTVTRIRVRVNRISASPTYSIGLKSDNSGNPSDTWLTYANATPSATGWLVVNIPDYVITSGIVYHIVIEYTDETIDSTHYTEFRTSLRIVPHTLYPYKSVSDSSLNYLWNGGTGWSVQNHAPIFLLDYSDDTYFGQPYHDISNIQEIYGTRFLGEIFSPDSNKVVNQVSVYVKKVNTPNADLTVVLYCLTDSEQIFSVDVTPEEVTSSFSWITKDIGQTTLDSAKTYRLYLKSTGSDSTNRYRCLRLTTDGFPYQTRTYDGTTSKYSGSSDSGSSWTDQDAYDTNFIFRFSSVRATLGTSISNWLTNDPFQRKGFYDSTTRYIFYFHYNGSDYVYRTSENGSTWSSDYYVRSPQGGASAQEGDQCFAIHWNGSYVNFVYANNGVSQPILYRRGTVGGDPPEIIWEAWRIVYNETSRQFAIPNIITDSDSSPWIVTIAGGGGWSSHNRVWQGSQDGTNWSPTAGEIMPGSNGGCCEFAKLTGGKLYLVEGQHQRPGTLHGWLYDGTGWNSTAETITSDLYRHESFSVVSVGDNVEVLYLSNATNVYKILHKTRTYGSGWGSATLIEDNQSYQSMPVVAKTGSSDLRVFWFHNGILYYKARINGGWVTNATTPFGTSFHTPNPDGYYINCFPVVGVAGGLVGVSWREGSSSPYSAMFGYIVVPPQ